MVIFPPKAIVTFYNMATRFPNTAKTWRNLKTTFYNELTQERCKCPMIGTNNSMTISQGIDLVTNQSNEALITFINKICHGIM